MNRTSNFITPSPRVPRTQVAYSIIEEPSAFTSTQNSDNLYSRYASRNSFPLNENHPSDFQTQSHSQISRSNENVPSNRNVLHLQEENRYNNSRVGTTSNNLGVIEERYEQGQRYHNQNSQHDDQLITETEGDYCHIASNSMSTVVRYVLSKADKNSNADSLCLTCWKFVTQQKRKTQHAGHKTVTKSDYAANAKSDKIPADDETRRFLVTKDKIIKLARENNHVDQEGKIKKLQSQEPSSPSVSPSTRRRVSSYITRRAEASQTALTQRAQQYGNNQGRSEIALLREEFFETIMIQDARIKDLEKQVEELVQVLHDHCEECI